LARLAAVKAETSRFTAEAERRKKIAAEKEAAVMRLSAREDELHRSRQTDAYALKKASQDRIGAETEARKKAAVLAAQEEKMSVERERELEAQMKALLKCLYKKRKQASDAARTEIGIKIYTASAVLGAFDIKASRAHGDHKLVRHRP